MQTQIHVVVLISICVTPLVEGVNVVVVVYVVVGGVAVVVVDVVVVVVVVIAQIGASNWIFACKIARRACWDIGIASTATEIA